MDTWEDVTIGNCEQFRFCPICTTHLEVREFDGTPRNHCSNCGFIRFRNPSPSAGAIAIMDEKIVMIKRGRPPSKGKWAFPSGFLELGETPEEGVLRELEEESGVTGEIVDLIGVYYEQSEVWGDLLVIMYLVKVIGGTIMAGDDADDARLFTSEEVPRFKFTSFRESWNKAKIMLEELGYSVE